MSIVQKSHRELLETYERRLEEFEHNLDSQTFHRDAEQAEAWIAFREGLLGNDEDDLGVSASSYMNRKCKIKTHKRNRCSLIRVAHPT